MIYFDTAYLAKCYLSEHGSAEVRELASREGRVACSAYGRIQLAASFHRNLRQGTITAKEFRLIWKQYDLDEEKHIWTWLPVSRELLEGVMEHFGNWPLQYSFAPGMLFTYPPHWSMDLRKFTSDAHLLAAAKAFKIKGVNVISTHR